MTNSQSKPVGNDKKISGRPPRSSTPPSFRRVRKGLKRYELKQISIKLKELKSKNKSQSTFTLKGGRGKLYSFEKYKLSRKSNFGLPMEESIDYDGRPVLPLDHVSFEEQVKSVAMECLPTISIKVEKQHLALLEKQLLPAITRIIDVDADKLKDTFPWDEFLQEAREKEEDHINTRPSSLARSNAEDISSLTGAVREGFTGLTGAVRSNKEDISSLTSVVREGFSSLTGAVRSNKEDISSLTSVVRSNKEDISSLTGAVRSNKEDINSLTGSHRKLSTDVENIKQQLSLSVRKSLDPRQLFESPQARGVPYLFSTPVVADRFERERESPGREPPMQQQVPPYQIHSPTFLQGVFDDRQAEDDENVVIMRCRKEILDSDTFQFPRAIVFSEDVVDHCSQLLSNYLLSGPAANPIGTAVWTTGSCRAAIIFQMDERDNDFDLDQALEFANPGMIALGLAEQYCITITLGDIYIEIGVMFGSVSAAEQMMTALLFAAAGIPNATMIQIDGPSPEFSEHVCCENQAFRHFMTKYPHDNATTLQFLRINFIEKQSTLLVRSYNPLIFDKCSFQNNGTDFAQADVLMPGKQIKVRVCFLKAINFGGDTEKLLNNLECAVNNGTMAYLCFKDIDFKSQAELDALRNVCQAADDKGWQVLFAEDFDFNQGHCLVLCNVTFGRTKGARTVYDYCTSGVGGD